MYASFECFPERVNVAAAPNCLRDFWMLSDGVYIESNIVLSLLYGAACGLVGVCVRCLMKTNSRNDDQRYRYKTKPTQTHR